ncbi:MAG: hypothetical protein ABW360_13695 [Phenylobacterium sp.]
MKLLLRRSQRSGLLGKIVFSLEVRASLTDEEHEHIRRYKFGEAVLYERKPMNEGGSNEYAKLGHALAYRFLNLTISVNDLANGKIIECKDILDMLAAEQQVKEAAQNFKSVLAAAARFDGEEVLELA